MTQSQLQSALAQGCRSLSVELTDDAQQKLLAYLALFAKWNKAYNLSAVRNIDDMLYRHLLDSLSVLTYLPTETDQLFVDVGTGGGLPGIPLAIALPHWQLILLDSNGKKTRFHTEVKAKLALDNVTVINDRVEKLQLERPADGIISRAFASLADMVNGCAHLLANSGAFWPMKGQYPEQELADLPQGYKLESAWPLTVPDEQGERHLLKIVHL